MLDVRTIAVTAGMLHILSALVVVIVARYRFPARGTGSWAVGSCASGIGFVLMALRGYIPMFLSVVAANMFIFGGMVVVWNGMRLFSSPKSSTPGPWVFFIAFCSASAGTLYWYSMVDFNLWIRTLVYAAGFGVLSGGIGATLLRNAAKRPMVLFTAWVYLGWGATAFLWFFSELCMPGQTPGLMSNPPVTTLFSVCTVVHKATSVAGMILMLNESMESLLYNRTLRLKDALRRTENALEAEHKAVADNIRFGDMLSHEYRTPLSVMGMQLDVLEMEAEAGNRDRSPHLRSLRAGLEQLESIIRKGRSMKRYIGRAGTAELKPVELPSLIKETIKGMDAAFRGKISFKDSPAGARLTADADPTLLKTALETLLENLAAESRVNVFVEIMDAEALVRIELETPCLEIPESPDAGFIGMALSLHGGRIEHTDGKDENLAVLLHLPLTNKEAQT